MDTDDGWMDVRQTDQGSFLTLSQPNSADTNTLKGMCTRMCTHLRTQAETCTDTYIEILMDTLPHTHTNKLTHIQYETQLHILLMAKGTSSACQAILYYFVSL